MYIHKYFFNILFCLIGLVSIQLKAEQVFSISEINSQDFPRVKASFVALNASGNSYKNLSKNDFVVLDNGFDVTSTVNVECVDSLVNPAVSILLVLDKSTSMYYEYESGETRWSWVKLGATSFINTIEMNQGTSIAITSFAKLAGLVCPFTNNKRQLLDSIDNIKVGGGTEYDPPFLDYRYGAPAIFKDGSPDLKKRRIVVFLTDGEPNHDPSVDSIKTELTKANIQVYSITLAMPMNKDLSEISYATGGGAYAVYTKQELEDIYTYIALDIQKKQFCTLSWDSPFGCSDINRYRSAKITFLLQGATVDRNFVTPPSSVASVEMSEPFLEFGDPKALDSVDLTLTLTARNSSYNLTGTTIQPATFFKVVDWDALGNAPDPPFVLNKDESRTIKVRFTQGSAKLYRTATMNFEGTPCPPIIQLIGGVSQIRIVTPNKGETFSTCDTVEIRWTGIEATKPVNLSYSSNNGTNWNPIATNITGLLYNWKPPTPGNQYLVRGTVAPVSNYLWAKSAGGNLTDVGASIAVTDDNSFFYVTGNFEGTAQFGSKVVVSRGVKDIFLAKYDRDGTVLWVETAGGPGYDSSNAVCVDNAGNAYITGVCYSNSSFGNITPNIQIDQAAYCFIAKYGPNGGTPSVQLIGPNPTYTSFQAGGTKIRYRPTEGELDVQGMYINSVVSPFGYSLPKVTVPTKFTAVLKSDLTFGPVSKGGTDYPDYSSTTDFDSDGNRYTCGSFRNSVTFGTTTLNSAGQSDVYINKFGGTPGSEDICDTVFAVEAPKLNFTRTNVIYSRTTLGNVRDSVLSGQLCNIGSIPITITNARFIGTNPNDFVMTSNPISLSINPGECIPLEIGFRPTDIGPRAAQLLISGSCAQDVFMNLAGDGVCSGSSEPVVDFKGVNLGMQKPLTIQCLFKNTNPTTVLVTPRITGPNAGDFTMDQSAVFVQGDSCFTREIKFIPTAPGPRIAVLEFILPQGCENPITELHGIGVETALTVNPTDFGGRRVKTINDSTVVIFNNSVLPARIDSLGFETDPTTIFSLSGIPALPYDIPSKDSLVLNLRFEPLAELNYTNNIFIYAQANASPVYAEIMGKGTLPYYSPSWICDNPVPPGKSSTAYLVIKNPSSTADLFIYSMDFKYKNGDFNWVAGTAPTNVIIPKGGQQTFDVTFTPQTSGTRADLIVIKHDAAEGPDIAPVVTDEFEAECDGLGLTAPIEIDFGGVLICDELIKKLTLTNESWQTAIAITNTTITGADAQYFEIDMPPGLVVDPGNFKEVDVKFKPDEARSYSAELRLTTSINYDIVINLVGVGEYLYFTASQEAYKNEPGLPIFVPIKLRVNKLESGPLQNIKVQVTYDYKMAKLEKVKFVTIPNWTWAQPNQTSKGSFEITGSGVLPTPFNGDVFEINWTIYLADVAVSDIKFKPIIGTCITKDTNIADIEYLPFCFQAGRLVVLSGNNYYLKTPEPNPVTSDAAIKFGIGLDGFTEVEIYNTLGEKVKTLMSGEMKSGEYEFNLSTEGISSGQYLLVLRSSHVTKTERLIINR